MMMILVMRMTTPMILIPNKLFMDKFIFVLFKISPKGSGSAIDSRFSFITDVHPSIKGP